MHWSLLEPGKPLGDCIQSIANNLLICLSLMPCSLQACSSRWWTKAEEPPPLPIQTWPPFWCALLPYHIFQVAFPSILLHKFVASKYKINCFICHEHHWDCEAWKRWKFQSWDIHFYCCSEGKVNISDWGKLRLYVALVGLEESTIPLTIKQS